MGDLLTFAPRPKPTAPPPVPLTDEALRARIEAAAEVAVDTAERLIAILDTWDGDADLEPDAEAEPSLAVLEGQDSQLVWTRGGDADGEADAAEAVLPEVIRSPMPRVRPVPGLPAVLLPWGGNGNVISAAGIRLFALVAGEA